MNLSKIGRNIARVDNNYKKLPLVGHWQIKKVEFKIDAFAI